MSRQIEDEVRQNRRDTARAFAADRQPATDTEQTLRTAPVPVSVTATVTISTRPLNNTLIVGHPDQAQGGGAGVVGDDRGGWAQQTQTETTLSRDGRRSLATALAGEGTIIDSADIGDAVVSAFDIDAGSGTTRIRSSFRVDESPATVSAAALEDSASRTVISTSVSDVAADMQTEVRLDVALQFTSEAGPSAAVTDIGAVADAIRQTSDEQLVDVAVGTDGSKPAQSDTALGNEVIRKTGKRTTTGSRAESQTIIGRGEPSTQPHDLQELGIYGPNSLILRVTFGNETKDGRIRLRAGGGLEIK